MKIGNFEIKPTQLLIASFVLILLSFGLCSVTVIGSINEEGRSLDWMYQASLAGFAIGGVGAFFGLILMLVAPKDPT